MARTSLSLPFDGQRLREARERAGLSQGELAKLATEKSRTSVSRFQVGRAECGVYKPQPRTLEAFVTALNISVDDLLTPLDEARQESA